MKVLGPIKRKSTSKEDSHINNGDEPRIYGRDEHSISRNNIDDDALKIIYRLIRAGHIAYIVGGGVRDILLGKKPKDFDIATDARPNQVRQLFRNCRIIGRRFKLAHIYFQGGKIIEVATFRDEDALEEGEEGELIGGARIENRYGTAQTDAHRRDLTINGLYYDLSTFSIIDYVGGIEDLRLGIIRIIGDPYTRFQEDPVRMIRTIRHSARTGFPIEETCYKALLTERELINSASTMRVYEETIKDLKSGYALTILALLSDTHILELLLPEICSERRRGLDLGTDLVDSVRKIDLLVQKGINISSTLVLTVIALFCGTPSLKRSDLIRRFSSIADIKDHIKNCFHPLAVPRKEKDRITDLMIAWWLLDSSKGEELDFSGIYDDAIRIELQLLCEVLAKTPEDLEISDILLHPIPEIDNSQSKNSPNRKRRRRRRTRNQKTTTKNNTE